MSEPQAAPVSAGTDSSGTDFADWRDAVGLDELRAKGKLGLEIDGQPLMLAWSEDHQKPCAFYDVCVHKQRLLSEGVILNGRIVCPGHQWSYNLDSGYCEARDRYQPTYRATVEDGRVLVDLSEPIDPTQI